MYVKSGDASPGDSPNSKIVSEHLVKRDGARPLSFAGVVLANASQSYAHSFVLRAAVYRTVGGKIIATLTRELSPQRSMLEALPEQNSAVFHKAAVFDSIDGAMGFFRPGPLTDEVRKQLGLDDPIRIP